MKRIYFTLTGTNHHYGHEFFEPDMTVRLVKEPDNEVDKEAIKVELEGRSAAIPCRPSLCSPSVRPLPRTSCRRMRRRAEEPP